MGKEAKKIEMTLSEYRQTELGPIWQIFDFSANIFTSLYTESTAIKVPEACYRGALFTETRLFSEEYLLNSKRCSLDMALPLGVFSYGSFPAKGSMSFRHFKEEEELEKEDNVVQLPPYKNINAPLGSVIRSRRSIREMAGAPTSLVDLSTILFHANGVTGDFNLGPEGSNPPVTETLGSKYVSKVRTVSSGGGLFPIYLYLVIQNVEGLPNGVYLYLPIIHSLKKVRLFDETDRSRLQELGNWGLNVDRAKVNVMVFYIYSLYENSRKYVDMGLTFGLIEAGGISQNIHLTCTALNAASCDIGGYDKVPCERFLGVDGLTKHVIHLTIIGT